MKYGFEDLFDFVSGNQHNNPSNCGLEKEFQFPFVDPFNGKNNDPGLMVG